MDENQNQPTKTESSNSYNLPALIIISAIILGVYGIHDFLMRRHVYGAMHLLAFLIAYAIVMITGNLLALIIVVPASYVIGLVEAFIYGRDFRIIRDQETANLNDNADKNSDVQLPCSVKEARIADEKAKLDKQLKEGKIDGVEYNKRIIELTVPEEPKPVIEKSSKLARVLWALSLFNAIMVIYHLYEDSKSYSGGGLAFGLAIIFYAPLTVILTITATIVTASNSKKNK